MHLLLDVLLSDSREMALRKVALATAAARPDIQFSADQMRDLSEHHIDHVRRDCLSYARRLRNDENGLDLMWMMLAAKPNEPWTFGFVDRLGDAFTTMIDCLSTIEQGLVPEANKRFERWESMKNGFPAFYGDPFKQVVEKHWQRALAAKKDRDRDDRAAAAVASLAAERTDAPNRLRDLARSRQDDMETEEDGQPALWTGPPGVTVIQGDAKLHGLYRALTGVETLLAITPELREIRNTLRAEYPHAHAAIDLMLLDLRPGEPLAFRPVLLVGKPGCGKSRMVRRLGELLNVKVRRYDGAASADNAFGGSPKRWSSASPAFPLQAIADSRIANPVVMIDELDKAGASTAGSLAQALMPFLERETAAAYPDPCLEVEADLSHVSYIMTANDDSKLPSPLRDRIRLIKVPSPTVEHLESLTRSIMQDLAFELNIPTAFLTSLAPDEFSVVAKAWGDNGSVRRLQKIIRGTVTARDQHAVRH